MYDMCIFWTRYSSEDNIDGFYTYNVDGLNAGLYNCYTEGKCHTEKQEVQVLKLKNGGKFSVRVVHKYWVELTSVLQREL